MSLDIGRQVIGVELRDGALCAVLCRRGWRGVRVVDAFHLSQAQTLPAESVAAQFHAWRDRHNAAAAWISVIMPRELVVCRNITVPLPEGSELRCVIGLQLDGLHPYEDEDVLWDCIPVSGPNDQAAVPDKPGQLRKVTARVAVARRSAAEGLLDWLRELGIAVSQLTVTPVAALGLESIESISPAEHIIGVWEGQHLELFAPGDAKTVRALSASLLIDPDQSAAEAAARVIQSIESLPGVSASALAVSGAPQDGTALWPDLKAELAKSCQVTELSDSILAEAAAREAIRTDPDAAFNLLPASERHYEPRVNLIPTYALSALLLVLAGLLGLQGTIRDLRQVRALDAQLESLRPRVAALSSKQDQMTQAYERLIFLKSVRESSRVPLDVMEEVAQRLPQEAWLQQLQMDGKTATLSGNAGSASVVLQELSAATQLDSPQFLSAILRSNEGQESFRIGARLRQPLR